MSKYRTIKALGEQYQNFPFKAQMYAIYSLSKVLNAQVYFEQVSDGSHKWTVQASNGRTLGRFMINCKTEASKG